MKTIIAGSRSISDYELVKKAIEDSGFTIAEVVCGKARGVDALGERWAQENGVAVKPFPADWSNLSHPEAVIKTGWGGKKYDAAAGHRRNRQMAEYAEALILVWDGESKGSLNMRETAQKLGLIVFEQLTAPAAKMEPAQGPSPYELAREWLADPNGIIVDTETTGFGKNDEIIQIAILDMQGQVLMDQMIKPTFKTYIHPQASEKNGITMEKLWHCPTWADVWPLVAAALRGKNMVAHNAPFDQRMITNACARHGLPAPPWNSVRCSSRLVMPIYGKPGKDRVSLVDACASAGVEGGGVHEGVADARSVLNLLRGLRDIGAGLAFKEAQRPVGVGLDVETQQNTRPFPAPGM